jgi:hypothetical protein
MTSNYSNQPYIKTWKIIIALLSVNIAGICLRYFNISTFIIILGFRLHISFILPFFIVFSTNFLPYIKKSFIKPDYTKIFIFLLLIILPLLIEAGGLYLSGKLEVGDPDYFYEFGISSIFDYPIYLIWNVPQIILLFFFLTAVSSISKFKFLTVAITIILLFGYELVPFNKSIISYWDTGILISCSFIFSILINYYRNIYWFGLTLFTFLWLGFLAFGSNSASVINILFASQYKTWEGFFDITKELTQFVMPVYFGIALLISVLGKYSFKSD